MIYYGERKEKRGITKEFTSRYIKENLDYRKTISCIFILPDIAK